MGSVDWKIKYGFSLIAAACILCMLSDAATAEMDDDGHGRIKAEIIGRMNGYAIMSDLIQLHGRVLLATTDGAEIEVYELSDPLRRVAALDNDPRSRILSVKWWRPSADRPLYLAVAAWSDQAVDSAVFAFQDDRLVPLRKGIDTILAAFDVDADGMPEVLLSQEFDANEFFGRRIKEIYWDQGRLTTRQPTLALPPSFTVIGGQLADLTQDGKAEAIYVRRGILQVYADKKALFTSAKKMGGSLSVLTYKTNPIHKDFITASVSFEIAPVRVDIDGDGMPELLAVSSDRPTIKLPGISTGIKQSRLVSLKYRHGGFVESPLGVPLDGAIQGLFATNGRVLCVTTGPEKPEQGQTSLLWEMMVPKKWLLVQKPSEPVSIQAGPRQVQQVPAIRHGETRSISFQPQIVRSF